jgi:hypothetical protein
MLTSFRLRTGDRGLAEGLERALDQVYTGHQARKIGRCTPGRCVHMALSRDDVPVGPAIPVPSRVAVRGWPEIPVRRPLVGRRVTSGCSASPFDSDHLLIDCRHVRDRPLIRAAAWRPGRTSRSPNRSVSRRAKFSAMFFWSARSMLTAMPPAVESTWCMYRSRSIHTRTSGGSSDNELKALTVHPAARPPG